MKNTFQKHPLLNPSSFLCLLLEPAVSCKQSILGERKPSHEVCGQRQLFASLSQLRNEVRGGALPSLSSCMNEQTLMWLWHLYRMYPFLFSLSKHRHLQKFMPCSFLRGTGNLVKSTLNHAIRRENKEQNWTTRRKLKHFQATLPELSQWVEERIFFFWFFACLFGVFSIFLWMFASLSFFF